MSSRAPPICRRGRWPAVTRAAESASRCSDLRRRAVRRGRARLPRVLRPDGWTGLGGNGRACADCHMATDHFQLSPAERRGEVPGCCSCGAGGIRTPTIRCFARSTRTTSGPTATNATDFSNLRQNGLVRITFTLPPNIRLIDPATNAPSAETFVDVWRMRADGQRRRAHRSRTMSNPWPRGPNPVRRIPAGRAASRRSRSRRSARSTNHAQIAERAAAAAARRPRPRFSACCSRTIASARCPTRSESGTMPLPDPDPRAQRARAAGQGRCSRARAASATAARTVERRQAPVDSIPRHLERSVRVPSTPVTPLASRSRPARRDSRAMRGPTRSRMANRQPQIRRTELRSRPRAC